MFLGELRQYTDRKVFIALLAIMLVMVAATVGTISSIDALLSARSMSIADSDVRATLQNLQSTMTNAESAQRGYLLTGDETYLGPYKLALVQLPDILDDLKTYTNGRTESVYVNDISLTAKNRLAELEQVVTLRQQQGPEAAQAVVATGLGEQYTRHLRSATQSLIDELGTKLAEYRTEITLDGNRAATISAATLIIILILAALVYFLFLKAIESERYLDRAKDEFVSLASHQLRTPATGIKSILSTLLNHDFGELNERQQYFLGKAAESNERELRIIEELLNVAKADAGRLVLKPGVLDLKALIDNVVTEQRRSIEAKNIDLNLKLPDKAFKINGDEEKLFMAIGNLVDNARKYTPDGGSVTVSLRKHKGHACVEVIDSGIGIDEADLSGIFDRFQRANNVLAGTVEGTGLGLYLARRIAELHSGTIEVISKKGEGTTFELVLPARRG